ncbi:serine/threonine-protein kinase [Streptomyces milbemycinicus]|uniref:non-specific serine/threonine protein kinase n=2 Tax=Streptomyces milbemycinicus TaxID=476552 RepID=A0ABW8LWE4_9ACTN
MLVADRYRLETPIGRGGMGEVWRATDEVLRRTVAVKLLLGDDPASQAAARFRLEAQTAARLSHPNIVGVFDFGARDGRFYLVMELVEGQSLAQELTAQGALRAERVAAIAAQGAAGLASAHRTGIVHRDIKPGNLMSDADGTVKIGDFGIARFVDDPATALTTAGQIIGTSLYLAPERALGRPASPASDVYSLGCLLYQLLTGTPPFQADTSAATLAQHIDAAPVPPSQRGAGLPPAFENYLLGMLAKQPEERPTAQHIADWFGSGAWQGHPEPMPQPAPAPAPAPMPGPLPHAQAFGTATPQTPPAAAPTAGPPRAPETPSVATYRLPQPAPARRPARGHRSTSASPSASPSASTPASAPAKRRGARELIRRRPRVASLIAGAVAFIAAVLIGIAWFSS